MKYRIFITLLFITFNACAYENGRNIVSIVRPDIVDSVRQPSYLILGHKLNSNLMPYIGGKYRHTNADTRGTINRSTIYSGAIGIRYYNSFGNIHPFLDFRFSGEYAKREFDSPTSDPSIDTYKLYSGVLLAGVDYQLNNYFGIDFKLGVNYIKSKSKYFDSDTITFPFTEIGINFYW